MKKRLISLIVAVVMLFSMLCPAAYADDETVSFDTCTHEWETPLRSGYSITIPGSDVSFSVKTEQCKKCKWYKHVATIFIAEFTYYSPLNVDANGLVPTELATYWANVWYNNFGKNATATKFAAGGGSTSGGGVGRPKGYSDDSGTANISSTGAFQVVAHPVYNTHSLSSSAFNGSWFSEGNCLDNDGKFYLRCLPNSIYVCNTVHDGKARHLNTFFYSYAFDAPVDGLYYCDSTVTFENFWNHDNLGKPQSRSASFSQKFTAGKNRRFNVACDISLQAGEKYGDFQIPYSYTVKVHDIVLNVIPETVNITNYNSLTVNNNTWNGNIYVDKSNNLTYIYPQYTTVNEKNETVTNISNTPIIYNNETKQYYTYDQTTKNYYYITYNAPSPSPTPAPTEKPGGSISTPETGKPGGDTGDTTGILAVLVEIRDNMIQGFLDIKAAFVAGFAELSANFTLAIENLNVNIQNVFNKKFPDQSTPETALPSPTPSPSPAPVEPILPANRFRIIPNMTSNTFSDSHGTWSAFGSSEYSSLYTYFRAFTVDSSYWWTSSQSKKSGSYDREMPCWLAIEIPDPENYYIDGYVLKGAGSGIYYDDWQFQYSDDGSAWTDLDSVSDGGLKDQKEHDFNVAVHKAHKYYRWYFTKAPVSWPGLGTANLYGYNAKDVVTPTPSPSPAPTDPPSPSPAPDPGKPDSGDKTNNFWTIIFPNGGGSEDGKKGVFWALVSLILALIAFFANLAVGVGYLFPFLPDGVVMTINTCLIVIFLFTIIKFIMRSK